MTVLSLEELKRDCSTPSGRPSAAMSIAQMLSKGIPADAEAPLHVYSVFETAKALDEVSRDIRLAPDDQLCLLETIAILTHVVQRSAGK